MTKIVLSASRDIPLNKPVLSQANVRRIKAGVSVDEARRGHRPARPVAVLGPLYPQPTGAGPARAALASYLRFRPRR